MTINVKIIADTEWNGSRITTMQLTYPRFIHSQLMTHRVCARNARSSRAVPAKKLIEETIANPVYPVQWGRNMRGMVAEKALSPEAAREARVQWDRAMSAAIQAAEVLADLRVHKQLVNRVLEPFSHIHTVMTATSEYLGADGEEIRPWEHFFNLRCAHDAQPEIQELANLMKFLYDRSVPAVDDSHLPYVLTSECEAYALKDAMRIAAMRCARVSYNPPDAVEPDPERDLARIGDLIEAGHHSPLEHTAVAGIGQWGVLFGWQSLRSMIGA